MLTEQGGKPVAEEKKTAVTGADTQNDDVIVDEEAAEQSRLHLIFRVRKIIVGKPLVLCKQVVTAHGVTWTAGYETWALWGISVRVCITVALKGKKAYGFFKRLNNVASGHKGDQDILVWPLSSLVKFFFANFFFVCHQ